MPLLHYGLILQTSPYNPYRGSLQISTHLHVIPAFAFLDHLCYLWGQTQVCGGKRSSSPRRTTPQDSEKIPDLWYRIPASRQRHSCSMLWRWPWIDPALQCPTAASWSGGHPLWSSSHGSPLPLWDWCLGSILLLWTAGGDLTCPRCSVLLESIETDKDNLCPSLLASRLLVLALPKIMGFSHNNHMIIIFEVTKSLVRFLPVMSAKY